MSRPVASRRDRHCPSPLPGEPLPHVDGTGSASLPENFLGSRQSFTEERGPRRRRGPLPQSKALAATGVVEEAVAVVAPVPVVRLGRMQPQRQPSAMQQARR